MPILQVAVVTDWPAIITSLGGILTIILAFYIAVQQTKVKQLATDTKDIAVKTEVNTNHNLQVVANQLAQYMARQEAMITALGEHPDAAAIFREIIKPGQTANPPPSPMAINPPLSTTDPPVAGDAP